MRYKEQPEDRYRDVRMTTMNTPAIRIHKIPIKGDYWGRTFKRPLRSDLIEEALAGYFAKPGNALFSSLETLRQRRCNPGQVNSVTASLFQEGDYAYVFRVRVDAAGGEKSRLAMILAKHEGKMSRVAKVEHENLVRLYGRCEDAVVKPLEGGYLEIASQASGKIVVSARRRRSPAAERERPPVRVYAYFTKWLDRHHELGVHHKTMNFYVNELPFQYFDSRTSDRIKSRMLAVLFRLFDPLRREAVEPPKVGAGDFVVTRKTPHDLKLIACRKILRGITLDRCVRLYLGYQGSWGGRLFTFVPRDVALLHEALIEGLVDQNRFSREEVFLALKRYRESLTGMKGSNRFWTPLETLDKLFRDLRPPP